MDFRNITGKMSKLLDKYKFVLLIILIGLALMMIPGGSNSEDSLATAPVSDSDSLQDIEKRLSEILSSVKAIRFSAYKKSCRARRTGTDGRRRTCVRQGRL